MTSKEELSQKYSGCPNNDIIEPDCNCPHTEVCELHGHCCACVAWHRDHGQKPLPHCLRVLDEVQCQDREGII